MTFSIALYLNLTQMHHQGIARGAVDYANSRGWRISGAYWPMNDIGDVDKWKGDGIIAAVESMAELRTLRKAGVPIVDISGAVDNSSLTRVSNDNVSIGRAGSEHLAAMGYGHCCFAAAAGSLWSEERLEGFAEATAAWRKGPVSVFRKPVAWWHAPEFSPELAVFLRRQKRPCCLMAANDIIGMNVVGACRMAKLSIPGDVALVSVDNEELLCELSSPSMSSIPFDRFEIGFRAAERLDALMQDLIGYLPPLHIPALPVVKRASSTFMSSADATLNAALVYIRQNACRGIGAVDVCRQVACSRRTLENKFRAEVGHSILHEIHMIRVEHATHLLLEPGLPINKVSSQCGFNSVSRFIVIFTEFKGEPPREYRKRKGIMR